MSRHLFRAVLLSAAALTTTAAAQTPANPPPTTSPTARDQTRAVTVEGCLMREADVPGRAPNAAERAGVGEDYILTNAKVIKGTPPAAIATGSSDKPVGTAGARGSMFEVEGIDDEKLKPHVGHRVQIDGTFENVDRARATPEAGTPADDLVELSGTTLRHVAGECTDK